jgi:hypothetical protein
MEHYERCPTCGSPVRLHVTDEGTGSYEPLVESLARFYTTDLFSPLSNGEMETVKAALLGCGVRNASDRLHAQWARHFAGLLDNGE